MHDFLYCHLRGYRELSKWLSDIKLWLKWAKSDCWMVNMFFLMCSDWARLVRLTSPTTRQQTTLSLTFHEGRTDCPQGKKQKKSQQTMTIKRQVMQFACWYTLLLDSCLVVYCCCYFISGGVCTLFNQQISAKAQPTYTQDGWTLVNYLMRTKWAASKACYTSNRAVLK